MQRKPLLVALFSFSIIASILALNLNNPYDEALNKNIEAVHTKEILPPSANISGTTEVCKDSSPSPQVTFTGSGGVAPYTFTYTINSGSSTTISTTGSNNSVSLDVNTGTIGVYVYQLISVADSTGDTSNSNDSAIITVSEPIIDFTFNNNSTCSGTDINFTSNITGNGSYTYNWNFGDSNTSSLNNPTHSYESLGCGNRIYNVILTVTDTNGCSASLTKQITVRQKPDISFTDVNSPFNQFNNCGNNTSDPSYTITVGNTTTATCVSAYDIDWGDGSPIETSVTFPATHTYSQLGSFNMDITGRGTNCDNTVRYLIKNSSNPTGAIVNPGNTVNLCIPVAPLNFAIASWGTNPPDTNYRVDFGDGSIELYTQSQLEASTYFNAADPANSQNFPIPHTYTDSNCPNGSYTVLLDIITSCGASNLTAGPIIILKKPDVSFENPPTGCLNTAIQFDNTSTEGFNQNCDTNAGYTWDFGDGNTSNLRDPSHTYTATGTYTVSLYSENFCGRTNTVTNTICIEEGLTADFTLNTNNGCSPLTVETTNTTDTSNSCGNETYLWEVSYSSSFCGTVPENWTFTGGTDENSVNPLLEFTTAGTYTLTLTSTNSCGDSVSMQTIEVKAPPTATITNISDFCGTASFSPSATVDSCAPSSETITYNWSFPGGTPATANTLDPGTIDYSTPGNYQITFSVTTSCGTTTDTEDFSINEIPTITNTNLTQTICSGTDSNAVALTSDIANTTYTWSASAPSGVSGFLTNGTTDTIPVQTLFNSNTTSEDVTFTITPSVGSCNGTPVNLVITVDPAPEFTSQPQSESICLNGPLTPLSVSVNGPGTPTFKWYSNTVNNTTTGTEIIGETNATYTPPNTPVGINYYYSIVSFSSSAGCNEITSNTAQIEIVDGLQITTNPTPTESICIGGVISAPLSVIHSGGTGIITYQWYSNATNSNTGGTIIPGATNNNYTPPTHTTSGNYYYYVTVSLGGSGCAPVTSDTAEIIVVDDPTITAQPLTTQELCQGTIPVDLEVTASGGLGTTFNYQWYSNTTNNTTGGVLIPSATNNIYTPSTTTVGTLYYYTIITQPSSGCSVTSATAEVIINQAPNITNQPVSETICFGESFNTLSVAYSNGVGTPTYQWYSNTINDTSTGIAITGATSASYNPPSGTVGTVFYYAIITFSSGGCTQITSQVAENTVNQTPNISAKSEIICSGNAFNIIPDNSGGDITPIGTTYIWSAPLITPLGTISGATQETIPQTSISQTLTNTTISPSTVTYTVTPTSGICTGSTFDVVITVNPSISITTTQTNSNCFSANAGALDITISGGVPFTTGNPYQITWNGPNGYTNTTEDISNLAPGDYTVNILDDGGCPFTQTFSITEPEELVFSAIDFDPETISCFGANDGEIGVNIAGGTPPYTYNWTKDGNPYDTVEDITNLGPGSYEITVTDANSCPSISQTFQVIEPPILDTQLTNQIDVICFGDATGEIYTNTNGGRQIEINPGTFDYQYNWTGPHGFSSTQQNITGLVAGTYNLIVTDKSGCTDTLQVVLNQSDEIIIDFTATEIECYGDNDASITINNIVGGNPPYSIAWSNLGSGMSQTNLSSGDYTITVTDNTNCVKSASITIIEPPIFDINPDVTNVSCFGENDGRITLNLVGGIAPVNLNWDDDPTAGVERNNIGPGTYTVTITDSKPCIITETFVITEPDALAASANTIDALDCDDANSGSINLIATGGSLPLTYSWSNGETTEDLSNIPPGDYTVNITDANNCSLSETFTINRFDPLQIDIDVITNSDCNTKTVEQSFVAKPSGGVPPYQINWSSGTVSGANNEIMQTSINGLVSVDVTDALGCNTTISYNVNIPVLGTPSFDLNSNAFNNFGFYSIQDPIQFTNTSNGDYISVSWDFGDGNFSTEENPIHTYTSTGTYTIIQTVVYPFNCIYTQEITLVIKKGYELIAPNAFTPNKDTLNELFKPAYIALFNMEFNIYTTWGELIYSETGDNLKGWNGKINDEDAENGNYYYTFSGNTFYGESITSKGAFVLIK